MIISSRQDPHLIWKIMSCFSLAFPLLLMVVLVPSTNVVFSRQEFVLVREGLIQALDWANGLHNINNGLRRSTVADCAKLYTEAELRMARLTAGTDWSRDDAVAWLSAVSASHAACLDGVGESRPSDLHPTARNLTSLIKEALAVYGKARGRRRKTVNSEAEQSDGLLKSWNPKASKADVVVAQDGSGSYKTIGEAVAAVAGLGGNRPERAVIYVKSGIYNEKVEIGYEIKNLMIVGDGMDKTVVTGNQNVRDGATTMNSATFGVSGDGFWARDMTFENTAGPASNQAVAARVSSDLSVFYRCGFRGYQDTLLVQSLRQFYRDCEITGTVDFIFGYAAAVFQNCDILVRRPMDYQFNTVTAHGREDPNANTGISIVNSRIAAAEDLQGAESYLGRPWKMYSRTVVMKTDLDGVIAGEGWREWTGDFGSTVYYAEYNNTGTAADTSNRVRWPGYHVLYDYDEANGFSAANFLGGNRWIPATGVPFWAGL